MAIRNSDLTVGRRRFLTGLTSSFAAPWIVSASAIGAGARPTASNRVTVGMIAVGRQTVHMNLPQFLNMPDVQVVAVCDVDSWRLANAKKMVEEAYAKQTVSGTYKGCATYGDYRELLADRTIDAVMVSSPDHWHVPLSMAAISAGKDVSCEKPLTRTISEGRQLSDAVRRAGRVFRTDSEFRSLPPFHRTCELVRNGLIGKLRVIRTGVPTADVGCPPQAAMPVPPELDYERWQGPAPRAPYTEKRVHSPKAYERPGWMRLLYYCDGVISNWGAHLNDIAQWGNNTDRTGPVEVEGHGTYPPADSFWNVLLTFELHYRYANGVRLIYKCDEPYVRFEGDDGWIQVSYPNHVTASSQALLDWKPGSNDLQFPLKSDKRDFIDAVKTRGHTLEDAEVGHRTASLCHIGHIAIRTGKKLHWDPERERFDDEAANRYLSHPIGWPSTAS